ncbi:MAG: DoxX family membrane protein [Mangrovibacterium sp.]|nr:DoxX family membrane protein [Mangrovibacterium sp.]
MNNTGYSTRQATALVTVRVLIGWQFLYEGLVKIVDPGWTAASFLASAQGPLDFLFRGMAASPGLLHVINFCNEWGLLLIGLSLMSGLLSRWACIGGMVLLMLYYISNPPFIGLNAPATTEGSYLIVNKNMVELFTLFILFAFPTDHVVGLGRLFSKKEKHAK